MRHQPAGLGFDSPACGVRAGASSWWQRGVGSDICGTSWCASKCWWLCQGEGDAQSVWLELFLQKGMFATIP